jgi:hypothetical protein
MADYDADHPYSPVRVFEAMKWEQTETCAFLRSNQFKLESSAEDAPKPKQTESSGTGWSLPKIPKNVELDSLIPKFKGFKK